MSNSFKTERSRLATKVAKIAVLVMFAVFAGWEAQSFSFNDGGGTGGVIGIPVRTAPPGPTSPVPANAQGGKGEWVFVSAGLDEANSYYSKNALCFDTKIGMPSSHSMVHYFEGTGRCDWARKNEYSKFSFQWTDPGSPLIPESVVQMTLTATIEFDQLRPDADRGMGAITVYVNAGDPARMGSIYDGQLIIGPGKKGDSHLPTSANKTIEWKVPRDWTKDDRLQISMQGSGPETKQIYNYWYEWREDSSGAEPPPPSSHPHVVVNPDGKLVPAPGYTWETKEPGNYRVRWSPGQPHPQHPNVVAGANEGQWVPAPGYEWVATEAGDLRVKPKDCTQEVMLYTNNNTFSIANGPTQPTRFTLDAAAKISFLLTYHWNNGRGQPPGSVGLQHQDGTLYGPWPAVGAPGSGGVANAYWIAHPQVVVKPGTYTVLDSHEASWGQNAQSNGQGIVEVKGCGVR